MVKSKNGIVLAASALILAATFGSAAPAAAGCGELCRFSTGECRPVSNFQWGCEQSGTVCYDVQCWGGRSLTTELVDKIAAAAEAGDMELAQKLAAGYPTLRIMKPGQMLFNGPQLAGLAQPTEEAPDGVRVACADLEAAAQAAPATPAEAPAATATDEQK